MAAVRCAVRRLGGSLLQRTQAAVAEEGRRLAPSRLLRSRGLSSENAPKIPKKEDLFEKQYQQSWEDLSKPLRDLEEYLKKRRPTEFQLRVKSIGESAKTLIFGSAKLTVFCMVAAAAFDGDGVEAKAVTKENQ